MLSMSARAKSMDGYSQYMLESHFICMSSACACSFDKFSIFFLKRTLSIANSTCILRIETEF